MPQASTNSSIDMKNSLLGMSIMSERSYNLENKVFWFKVHLLIFCGERISDSKFLKGLHIILVYL